jgi:hypothetical protein
MLWNCCPLQATSYLKSKLIWLTERTSSLSLSEESGIYWWWYDLLCLCLRANSVADVVSATVLVLLRPLLLLGSGGWRWWGAVVDILDGDRKFPLLFVVLWFALGTELQWWLLFDSLAHVDVDNDVECWWLVVAGGSFARWWPTSCFTQFPTLSVAEFCTTFCIFKLKESLKTWTDAVRHRQGLAWLFPKKISDELLRITRLQSLT